MGKTPAKVKFPSWNPFKSAELFSAVQEPPVNAESLIPARGTEAMAHHGQSGCWGPRSATAWLLIKAEFPYFGEPCANAENK
jgi:hypothetical protein